MSGCGHGGPRASAGCKPKSSSNNVASKKEQRQSTIPFLKEKEPTSATVTAQHQEEIEIPATKPVNIYSKAYNLWKKEMEAKRKAENAKKKEEEETRRRNQEFHKGAEKDSIRRLADLANQDAKSSACQQLDDNGEILSIDEKDDDDNPYDDDDEDCLEQGDGSNGGSNTTKRRRCFAHKPNAGSRLHQILKKHSEETRQKKTTLLQGQKWFPPVFCPLAQAHQKAPEPSHWYDSNVWQYYFLPFTQFQHKTGELKDYCCIHCGKKALESHKHDFRLMFCFDKIVWLQHRRVRCASGDSKGGCGRTFAEIDPRFLEQLPTGVVEQLDFCTTSGGPGMHQQMLYHFTSLHVKGIGFETYASSFNELYRLKYSMQFASYLDAASDYIEANAGISSTLKGVPYVPTPFHPFVSPGDYNGAEITTALVTVLSKRFMETKEKYIQQSFQMCSDEHATTDHTFKYANGIKAAHGRPGRLFGCSYTIGAKSGKVSASRMAYTKSNDEIEPVVVGYKQCRENAGSGPLLRYEGDGGGDGKLIERLFQQELKQGMSPHVPPTIDGCPTAKLSSEAYMNLDTAASVNTWCRAIITKLNQNSQLTEVPFGLDLEWNYGDGTDKITRNMSISVPKMLLGDDGSKSTVFINLDKLLVYNDAVMKATLQPLCQLLELPKVVPVGVNIAVDIARLEILGIHIRNFKDVMQMGKTVSPGEPTGYGMRALCARHLGLGVNKYGQQAKYSHEDLTPDLIHYAALDAWLSLALFMVLKPLTDRLQAGRKFRGNDPPNLWVGAEAMLMFARKPAARVRVDFMGGNGSMKKWGRATVGSGKCIVTMLEVLLPSLRPPFSYTPTEEDLKNEKRGWKNSSETIKSLFDKGIKTIMVSKGRLSLHLNTINPPQEQLPATTSGIPDGMADSLVIQQGLTDKEATINSHTSTDGEEFPCSEMQGTPQDQELDANQGTSSDDDPDINAILDLLPAEFYGDLNSTNDEDDNRPRSRSKDDLFHVFQTILRSMKRENPIRSLVSQSIILATFDFDCEDYDAVVKYLDHKKMVRGASECLQHFYFNKEWWRQRVRMYTPQASSHAIRVRQVAKFFQDTPGLKEHVNDTLLDCLEKFAQKCELGKYEELSDVKMFKWTGTDKEGLNLYIRFRGSNRLENVHQKMRVAFGPWGVGAETGHNLLVLVTYRYNVHTGIRRCGEQDHGHIWLEYIDRIDMRSRQLWGYSCVPNHVNVSEFKGVDGFVSVGIGPLSYNKSFVQSGEPDARLKGDMLFVARKMGVVCPPLPIATKEERRIFTDFLLENPKMTEKTWNQLAALFLSKTNCGSVFPKLPSMLKSHHKKWCANSAILAVTATVKKEYDELLRSLTIFVRGGSATTEGMGHHKSSSSAGIEGADGGDDMNLPTCGDAQEDMEGNDINLPKGAKKGDEEGIGEPEQHFIHVAPAVAPTQSRYVRPASESRTKRVCTYHPCCTKLADECNGHRAGWCEEVNSGRVVIPANFDELKKEAKKQSDRKRAAKNRKERKRNKQARKNTT